MQKRKIGIVCYPSVGGSGIVATELGLALCKRRYEVHFISYDVPHRLKALRGQCKFHHVQVPTYPLFRFPPYTIALSTELCRLVETEGLEVIHVHYAVPHSTSALLARMMLRERGNSQVRIITTLHGTDSVLVGQDPNYRTTVEFSINACDAVTAVSQDLKRKTLEMFNIRREVEVIHNPVDTSIFRPLEDRTGLREPEREFLRSLGIPWRCGERILMHVSNFRPVKRVADAIQVFDLISRAVPSRLVMIGDGPEMGMAQNEASSLGIANRVHFPGKVQFIENAIREADLVMSTSETESFGMTLAEAMASEVPVVAYRVGGVPEVVDHGNTGFLIDPYDQTQMAAAAVEILSSRKAILAMGAAGRKHVQDHFSPERIVPLYQELYDRTLGTENGSEFGGHPLPNMVNSSKT